MALSGLPLVNTEAVSPQGLALHVFRSMHPEWSSRVVSRDELHLALGGVLSSGNRAEVRLLRSSLESVIASIGSDRMIGRDAHWASRSAATRVQRLYAELFAAYEAFLQKQSRFDMADVHRIALDTLSTFGEERQLDMIAVCRETELHPLQKDLIQALGEMAKERKLLGTVTSRDSAYPRRAGVLLPNWPSSQEDLPDGTPVVIQAASRREEVWAVLDRVLEGRIPFEEVELAVTSVDAYLPVIEAACSRLGIPSTLDQAEDAVIRPVRDILVGLLQWISSGYEAQHLVEVLRMDGIRIHGTGESARDVAFAMEQFRLKPSSLARPDLDFVLTEGAKRKRIPVRQVRGLHDWFTAFRKWVPERVLPPRQFADKLDLCLRDVLPESILRNEAINWLERLLEPMTNPDLGPAESQWLAEWLLARVQTASVARDTGRGVHVLPLSQAGYGIRRSLFVLGLDDHAASTPVGDVSSHPVGLESSLPAGSGQREPVRETVNELWRRFGDQLVLSVPAWDVAASRSLFPGSALVERAKLENIKPSRRQQGLDAADAFRLFSWTEETHPFAQTRQGLEAEQARASADWTVFDGRFAGQEGYAPDEVKMSPSRVEIFLSCPYRFFLSEILGLSATPDEDDDWIDRATEGNILHELFERHTLDRMAEQATAGEEDEALMMERLRAALERQVVRSGQPARALVEARFRMLSHGVRQYFQRERTLEQIRRPVHAEFTFSTRADAHAAPVHFESNGRILRLTGQIDRIDEDPDGRWTIVDYKSSKPDDFVPEKLTKLDKKLQWALYAWAARQATGREVEASEYVFTSRQGSGGVSRVAAPADEQVEPLLESVLDRVHSGHLMPAPDEKATCSWCDFKSVCGDLDARKRSISEKFGSEQEGETDAYDQWAYRSKAMKGGRNAR